MIVKNESYAVSGVGAGQSEQQRCKFTDVRRVSFLFPPLAFSHRKSKHRIISFAVTIQTTGYIIYKILSALDHTLSGVSSCFNYFFFTLLGRLFLRLATLNRYRE